MQSDKEADALALYQRTFNIAECVQLINSYEQQKKAILEQQKEKERQAELERIRAEERAKIEAEQQKAREIEQAVAEAVQDTVENFIPEQIEDAGTFEHTVIIKCTDAEWNVLTKYMDSIGIDYTDMPF